jgi:hypothetical protein
MADDGPDDQRDERIATWLEPEPLDELTRRRLVAGAMQAPAEAPSSGGSLRPWRWIATAAVIVVALVGALAVFTAQSGNESQLSDARKKPGQSSDRLQQASPAIGAARSPIDVGGYGNLDVPANLRRLRVALEHPRRAAVAPSNSGETGSPSNELSTTACRNQLPAGTIIAVGSGTLDGRRALVVLTDRGDGSRSTDAVLADPCEVRPLS